MTKTRRTAEQKRNDALVAAELETARLARVALYQQQIQEMEKAVEADATVEELDAIAARYDALRAAL